jgi:hypothetical protein
MLAKAPNARSDGPMKQRVFSLDRPTFRASPDSTYAELRSYNLLVLPLSRIITPARIAGGPNPSFKQRVKWMFMI